MNENQILYGLLIVFSILTFMLFYFMEKCQKQAKIIKTLREMMLDKIFLYKDLDDATIDRLAKALEEPNEPGDDVIVEQCLEGDKD